MSTKRTAQKASKTATKKTAGRKSPKRTAPAKTTPKQKPKERDPRLPAVGSVLTRQFKGREIEVLVTEGGFEYEGETFKSVSACARFITGYGISGPIFFKLTDPKPADAGAK